MLYSEFEKFILHTVGRHLAIVLHRAAQDRAPLALTGPRGAGKTGLARREFPRHLYVNLEDPTDRAAARDQPESFLRRLRRPAILDEAHRAPELLAALAHEPAGGHLLLAPLKLGLAGVEEFHLLPPSLAEREGRPLVDPLALGHAHAHRPLPRLTLARALESPPPPRLDADLGFLVRAHDTDRVLRLLAELARQPAGIADHSLLARAIGVTHTTVARWLDALERLFVIARVPAVETDFGQRVVRRKKLFFLQPGWLAASSRFAAFAAAEIWKSYWHRGRPPALAHWGTATGSAEAALILEDTLALSFAALPAAPPGAVQSLARWKALHPRHSAALITAGHETQDRQGVAIHPWFAL